MNIKILNSNNCLNFELKDKKGNDYSRIIFELFEYKGLILKEGIYYATKEIAERYKILFSKVRESKKYESYTL